jgi:pimeloyl-ACP methyl ester carboxylesterase
VTVEIGGIPQGIITGLERHITIVWWEQRGAGMSFSASIPPETLTMAQMISDTIDVADYLRDRFRQDRILLVGHSWAAISAFRSMQWLLIAFSHMLVWHRSSPASVRSHGPPLPAQRLPRAR